MNSVLGIPIIRIAIILAMSYIFKLMLPKKMRDILVPWCFAGQLIHSCFTPFLGGMAHFLFLCLYFIEMAILLDGFNVNYFKRNPAFTAFMVFWGYLTLTSLWCDDAYLGVTWHLGALFELVLAGYFTGIWVLRTPDGLRRLLTPISIIGIFAAFFYFKYGFTAELDAGGRGIIDKSMLDEGMGTNVNQIGLSLAPIAASIMVMLLEKMPFGRKYKVVRVFSIITFVVIAYLLIRTGSRNACLVFLPCAYFAFKALRFTGRKAKTLFLLGIIGMALFLGARIFMRSESGIIRAFTFMESGGKFDLQYASSGRWYEFEMYLSGMSGIDWLIGQGPEIIKDPQTGSYIGGCLSVYVTLLRFVGVFGLFLLLIYFIVMVRSAKRGGLYGQVALLFFMAWAVTGIAEGAGLRRGYALRLLQGVSLALCSKLPFQRKDEMWHVPPEMQVPGYYVYSSVAE